MLKLQENSLELYTSYELHQPPSNFSASEEELAAMYGPVSSPAPGVIPPCLTDSNWAWV